MATTKGTGTGRRGSAPPADTTAAADTPPRARRARTRAPEDEIGGTAAPAAETGAAGGAPRGRGPRGAGDTPADAPTPDVRASHGRRRSAPGTVAAAPAASAPARRGTGKKKRETYTETAARRRKEKEVDKLQEDLRAFAAGRPSGWNHDDWLAFLDHLAQRGHDVSDQGAVGARLERERLSVVLEGIEGLGPKRVQSLADRYQTLWSMRHADAADMARVQGMNRSLAERVVQQLRERYS